MIQIEPGGSFGTEVSLGMEDVHAESGRDELRELFLREGLLIVRGVTLTMDQQRELCRTFGPVPDSPYENFYVSNTRDDGFLGTKELQWHNDVPYLPSPYLVATLHAVEVDADATSTQFASATQAYERLPQALKERIGSMKALQVRQRTSERANRLEDLEPGDLCTLHPVVRRQEGTGRPYLFVNENMTACIVGLSARESDELLAELYSYLYVAPSIYDHRWSPGDLVIWDNLSVQHARGKVGAGARTLQRVTCTHFTYAEQYPADLVIGQEFHNTNLLAPAA